MTDKFDAGNILLLKKCKSHIVERQLVEFIFHKPSDKMGSK